MLLCLFGSFFFLLFPVGFIIWSPVLAQVCKWVGLAACTPVRLDVELRWLPKGTSSSATHVTEMNLIHRSCQPLCLNVCQRYVCLSTLIRDLTSLIYHVIRFCWISFYHLDSLFVCLSCRLSSKCRIWFWECIQFWACLLNVPNDLFYKVQFLVDAF